MVVYSRGLMRLVYILYCIIILSLSGCVTLNPVEFKKYTDITKYKYAVIGSTEVLESGRSDVYYSPYTMGYVTYNQRKSINPKDIISGILMKKGFIIVDEPKYPKETVSVQYGQSGQRLISDGLLGYVLEVSIQILDNNQSLIYTCTAEGMGSTEADDIRNAITRCLEEFK